MSRAIDETHQLLNKASEFNWAAVVLVFIQRHFVFFCFIFFLSIYYYFFPFAKSGDGVRGKRTDALQPQQEQQQPRTCAHRWRQSSCRPGLVLEDLRLMLAAERREQRRRGAAGGERHDMWAKSAQIQQITQSMSAAGAGRCSEGLDTGEWAHSCTSPLWVLFFSCILSLSTAPVAASPCAASRCSGDWREEEPLFFLLLLFFFWLTIRHHRAQRRNYATACEAAEWPQRARRAHWRGHYVKGGQRKR